MKLLHVISTPRNQTSNTLRISNHFINRLTVRFPKLEVQTLDLFKADLPAMAGDIIEAKYMLMAHITLDEARRVSWLPVENLITQFLSADILVLSVPMWNFSIPYVMKSYIDMIVQPGYMFQFNAQGALEPLVHDKTMICVSSRGGDYAPNTYMNQFDFQEPYLRAIFGFIGITNITFVNAQPLDITRELREARVNEAIVEVETLAARLILPIVTLQAA